MTIGTVDIRPTAIACQVRDDVGATRRTSSPIIEMNSTATALASVIVASPIAVVVPNTIPVVVLATGLLLVFLLVELPHWQPHVVPSARCDHGSQTTGLIFQARIDLFVEVRLDSNSARVP